MLGQTCDFTTSRIEYPVIAAFGLLASLQAKEGILSDSRLSETEKSSALATLTIPPLKTGEGEEESPAVRLEDLALTFQYFPSSKVSLVFCIVSWLPASVCLPVYLPACLPV